MAHEMTAEDRMYSVRLAPWHLGSGTNVTMLDTNPEKRAERMVLAGHDWTVEEADVFRRLERVPDMGAPITSVTYPKLPGWKMLYRSDTEGVLHVGKDSYTRVQNVVGHELFEALSEGAVLEDGTGGTTKGGAMCYLTARVDEPVVVNGDTSETYPYVTVTWTHDGSGAVRAAHTSVRIVCQNTADMAELEGKRTGLSFTFRHTASVLERIEEAKAVITGARANTQAYLELMNELVGIPVSDVQREQFVQLFVPAPAASVVSERVLVNIEEARDKVRGVFNSPTIPEAHRNTAYGLVQAGLEYLDHLRGFRNQDTYLGRTLLRPEPLKARLVPMVRELVKA